MKEKVETLNKELIDLAQKLIAVPGYVELPEKETKVAEVLQKELCAMGVPSRLVDYDGRYNVSCEYVGDMPGPTVVLCTHLDTVPPYEMEDAFKGCVRDGKLYGRGAVDVRDILAAMAMVMKRLFIEKPQICGRIKFLAVCDEESGSYGMRQEIKHGYDADLTIVGEPTNLKLGVAHKGVAWLEVDFAGKSAHGSVPEKGHNAIYDAGLLIEQIQSRLIPQLQSHVHPILGTASINVGKIQGGTRPTIVPECCSIQIDRRLIPGETAEKALGQIDEILKGLEQTHPGMDWRSRVILGDKEAPFPPLDSSGYKELLDDMCAAIRKVTGIRAECIGLPFWTDAALPGAFTDTPAVVFGPGNIEQAHSNDEFVEIKQLEQAAEIYYEMALAVCRRDI